MSPTRLEASDFDVTAGSATMYVACWVLDLMAFLVAISLRPFLKASTPLASPA
ncbi:hypothetical protein [Rhizobium sp. C1]|uniref:hypothetical protein n=1 Tax=Rhizobium sp. C1 TaxID=1349799 RepID=UPI001E2EF748|nr:hypothetical protein [Rhizobium sp. C1]MCD2176978.1 hypothetical protein [Rhizobium sp. C1]